MNIDGLSYCWKGNSDYARENAISGASDEEILNELDARGYDISELRKNRKGELK